VQPSLTSLTNKSVFIILIATYYFSYRYVEESEISSRGSLQFSRVHNGEIESLLKLFVLYLNIYCYQSTLARKIINID